MRILSSIKACAFVLAVGCAAIQFAQGPLSLHKVAVISVDEQATLTVFPIKTDLDGNIYLRLYETGQIKGGPIFGGGLRVVSAERIRPPVCTLEKLAPIHRRTVFAVGVHRDSSLIGSFRFG